LRSPKIYLSDLAKLAFGKRYVTEVFFVDEFHDALEVLENENFEGKR